jgi:hypothetical protein
MRMRWPNLGIDAPLQIVGDAVVWLLVLPIRLADDIREWSRTDADRYEQRR